MKNKLTKLDEFNSIRSIVYDLDKSILSEIECPKCGNELLYSDNTILTSYPPQRNIHCPKCSYKGYKLA